MSDISNCSWKGQSTENICSSVPNILAIENRNLWCGSGYLFHISLGVANQLVGYGTCIFSGVTVAGGEATDVTCNRLERIINTDVAVSDCLRGVACCLGAHGGFGQCLFILATSPLEDMDV